MNGVGSSPLDLYECVHNFVMDGMTNELTKDHITKFEKLLQESDDARRLYCKYVVESENLQVVMDMISAEKSISSNDASPASQAPIISYIPGVFSGIIHSTIGFFSQEVPLGFLIAMLLTGLLLLGMWLTPVSKSPSPQIANSRHGDSFNAQTPEMERETNPKAKPEIKYVGHITGEVDCVWSRSKRFIGQLDGVPTSDPSHASPLVAYGERLTIVRGLLEITYDGGAKVTLKGPCTFNVERNGGFLAVGRLIGKMEKKAGTAFVIATPTALVTDLGTEFGVEVSQNGVSEVHVLRGAVDAKFLDASGRVFQCVELKQGEARHYERKTKKVTTIAVNRKKYSEMQIEAAKRRFEQWQAFSRRLREDPTLVAYYPLESSDGESRVLRNASAAGGDMDGQIVGARWANGRLAGKASLWFNDAGDRVALPHPERFNFSKEFSVAVWFQTNGYRGPKHAVIAKGDIGWRILQRSDVSGITFDTNSGLNGSVGQFYENFGNAVLDDNCWHHAVAVYRSDRFACHKYLYIDGQLDIQGDVPLLLAQNSEPVWIGNNSQHRNRAFCGWIDEVAIFSRALSAQEAAAMHASDLDAWLKGQKRPPAEDHRKTKNTKIEKSKSQESTTPEKKG